MADPPPLQITARDHTILAFIAEHRLVLAAHVQALLGTSARATDARLRALAGAGLLMRESVFHRQPACYRVTRTGLAAVGSNLPAPRLDLRAYRHDVGVAWLWLAAHSGTWGALREVLSERQLRSRDATRGHDGRPLAIRLGGYGPGGRERLHHPDLLLVDQAGRRIAVELELSGKGRSRREKILAGYAADARTDVVLYLVDDSRVGRSIRDCAHRLGISDLVHVQPIRWRSESRTADAAASRRHGRAVHDRGSGGEHAR